MEPPSPVKVAVPKETLPGETRVALVPESVATLVRSGFEILIEEGAGEAAFFPDAEYRKAGARLVSSTQPLFAEAEVVLKVQPPCQRLAAGSHEADELPEGAVLISFLYPEQQPGLLERLRRRKITGFAMERIPRISRAQKMDALSSQSTVAGYLAVLLAASHSPRFFPLLMTAAGTLPPAQVLVLGAGVAGLQAIATAKRLGARVAAFDVRRAVKEQVESLGAKFVGEAFEGAEGAGGYAKALDDEARRKEQELLNRHLLQADVVIATALVPGKKPPLLIPSRVVSGMKPGAVIVDLAAEQGGNCEATRAGETVRVEPGVTVLGPVHLPARMPADASRMYSNNVAGFLTTLAPSGRVQFNWEDEVLQGACVMHRGELR